MSTTTNLNTLKIYKLSQAQYENRLNGGGAESIDENSLYMTLDDGALAIEDGGTSATTAAKALDNLGAVGRAGGVVTAEIFNDYTNNRANSSYSHAEGYNTTADFPYDHAEGWGVVASGTASHAEGEFTTASGRSSHAEGNETKASNTASHAEGNNTEASGTGSHAEGSVTEASGSYSHAEGNRTKATSQCCHAEGLSTKASGNNAHAEGESTIASGESAHAEGYKTTASGNMSYAGGENTQALGAGAHAEGYKTIASGYYSHVEGSQTFSSGRTSHAEGRYTRAANGGHASGRGYTITLHLTGAANATYYTVSDIFYDDNEDMIDFPTDPEGICASWKDLIDAFKDGQAVTIYGGYYFLVESIKLKTWTRTNSEGELVYSAYPYDIEGIKFFKTLSSNTALSNEEVVFYLNAATGDSSHTENVNNIAYLAGAHAEGCQNLAYNYHSHAEGVENWALGKWSHSEGRGNQSFGDASHTEGYSYRNSLLISGSGKNYTLYAPSEQSSWTFYGEDYLLHHYICFGGKYVQITGVGTLTSNDQYDAIQPITVSASLSSSTITLEPIQMFMGQAYGFGAHSEGQNCCASGDYSHAEGQLTIASGACSHAEGADSVASGSTSHAGGAGALARGTESYAHGRSTIANNYQYVVGRYNENTTAPARNNTESQTASRIFIVGTGASTDSRLNGFTVNPFGKIYSQQSLTVGDGADYAEYFEWFDSNINNEDRRGRFVTLDGEKIRYATAEDSYVLGIVSVSPSVVGDGQIEIWKSKYLKDVFGVELKETVQVEESIDEQGEVVPAHEETRWILNPDFDPEQEYISREERSEWDPVGLVGKLVVIDDGTCQPNEYCYPGVDGIATASTEKTAYRVMTRLDDTHIKVFIK